MSVFLETVSEEEKLVAELELLGIGYLSRQTNYRADTIRPNEVLLADLMRQTQCTCSCGGHCSVVIAPRIC